jgi:hypothetical protein
MAFADLDVPNATQSARQWNGQGFAEGDSVARGTAPLGPITRLYVPNGKPREYRQRKQREPPRQHCPTISDTITAEPVQLMNKTRYGNPRDKCYDNEQHRVEAPE